MLGPLRLSFPVSSLVANQMQISRDSIDKPSEPSVEMPAELDKSYMSNAMLVEQQGFSFGLLFSMIEVLPLDDAVEVIRDEASSYDRSAVDALDTEESLFTIEGMDESLHRDLIPPFPLLKRFFSFDRGANPCCVTFEILLGYRVSSQVLNFFSVVERGFFESTTNNWNSAGIPSGRAILLL